MEEVNKIPGKADQGKTPVDLVPPEAILAIAEVFGFGAAKYEPRNWEGGMRYGRVYAAAQRHMNAWMSGEDTDPESGMPHLWHALTCLSMLVTYDARGFSSLDDRPDKELTPQ